MAKKKTYYDPQNGQHYYHGETLGASNWGAPESVKDESYINQYNYTPSYNAYRQYLEEEKRREEEEMARIRHQQAAANPYEEPSYKDPVNVKAGFAAAVPAPESYIAPKNQYDSPEFQKWVEDKEKAQKVSQSTATIPESSKIEAPKIMSEKDKKLLGSIGASINNAGQAKQQASDDFSKLTAQEKYKMYIDELEDKAKKQGTLPTSQRVEVSEYMYNHMTPEERKAIDTIMEAEGQEFEEYTSGGPNIDYSARGNYALQQNKAKADARSKELSDRENAKNNAIKTLKAQGWDDKKIEREVARFKELEDYRKTLEKNERYAINPNDSSQEKFNKSVLNTVEAIPSTLYRGLESLAAEKGAYGRNTSSRYAYSANAAQEAVGQVTQNAIGNDHPIWQKVYEAGEAGAESLVVMLTTNAIASGFGLAGAGTALSNAKKAGDTITGGMKAAAAAEKALEMASLVPFSANAYESGYKDAIERGYGEGQAQAYALSTGAIEAATEVFSLDRAWKMAEGTKLGRNLFASAAIQAGIEGSEEMVSEIGSRFADYLCVEVGKTGKTQKQIDIEDYMSQHPDATYQEAAEAAAWKFAEDVMWAGAGGVMSSAPHSAVMSSIGAIRSKYGSNITGAISDRYKNLEVKGDTAYENQLREDKEKYENNPTQYVVDNFKVKNEEDARIKQGLQEIADKEKAGKKLSTSDKAFIANNAQVDDEFIEKLYDIGEDSVVPYKYRDVKNDINEDQARKMLAEAALTGSAEEFAKAQMMVMNSRDEYVSQHADQIISDVAPMAQGHGITQEAIGKAIVSMKQAYIDGLKGKEIDKSTLSPKAQMAYNDARAKYIENRAKEVVSSKNDLDNAMVARDDGSTVKLSGTFDTKGVVTTDGETISLDKLDLSSESAIVKAYKYADDFKDVNTKNEFMRGIKDETAIEDYNRDFTKAHNLGMAGVSEETLKQGYTTLDDETRKAAFEAGQREARARATAQINKAWGVVPKAQGLVYNEANMEDKKVLNMLNQLASVTQVDFRVADPQSLKGERGFFDPNTNTITVSADHVIAVFHELGEFSEFYNKEGYDELKKAVADMSAKKFGVDNYHRMLKAYQIAYGSAGLDSSADEMSGEMFNDVISAMLSTDKGAKALAQYLADNYEPEKAKSLGQQIVDIVKEFVNVIKRLVNPDENNLSGEYQKAVYQMADQLSERADDFIKVLDKAVQNYKKAAQTEMEQKLDKVSVTNGEERQFSIATYEADGKAILQEYLEEYSGLSKKDQKAIIETLDWGYEVAKEMAQDKKFRSFGKWSKTGLVIAPDGTPMIQVMGNNGKPIQSVAVSNGEYPLNIDFTQVCKKRLALNSVLNRLVSDTKYDIRMLSESDIAGINALIKEHQFEIACGLCFVDARRYRVGTWAESFVNGKTDEKTGEHSYGWNELVNSMLKRGVQASYFHLASDHVDPLGANLASVEDKDIDFKTINNIIKPYLKADGTIGQTKINGKTANPTEEVRMAYLLKTDPSTRHLLDKNDIIASEGLDALRVSDPKVYALVNSHGGTSKPKLSHGFTAYGNEIIRSLSWGAQNNFDKENAYAVGGVRVQSFSDYVANMFFDYMQMFADMSARELPSHAYTKEPNYVKLFGMTGQRINMSLIFKGANLTEEQQARLEKLSKKGRKAVERDPEFGQMIKHAGLDEDGNYIYEDESFPYKEAYKIRKDARYKNVGTIAVGLSDEHIRKLLADPQIDMVIPYHSSGVSQIIKNARNLVLYTDYTDSQNTRTANGKKLEKGDYDWYANLKSEINPKGMTLEETVKDYLKWCDDHNYLPVFDQFRNEPGYWKLLVDFRSYDNNGKFMPQGKVSMTFPDNFKDIVKESLKEQQKFEDRLEAEMKDEQDALYSDVKNFLKEKGSVVETKFSLTVDSEGNNLTEGQQEYFKDSKIVDEQGRLKVMYHGSPNKFTIFDPKKLGGKNGTAEGFGIYFADTQEVTKAYGDEQLKGYLNVTHPASSFEKTITANDLSKLIKATAIKEAEQLVADGEYDTVDEAIKDSWVSNYVNTYEMSMDAVYKQVANDILKLNGNDMDIIQEVMAGLGIRDYAQAYDFYETLTDTLGIDGYVTNWTGSNGETSGIVVAFNSNQFKNIDNENPTENEDIRFSIEVDNSGKKYVDIQDDLISGITDDKQIKEYVRTYMKEYFPSIDMKGFNLPLNRDSRGEFTNSDYTKDIEKNLHDYFVDKMRMASNLDEIVNTADGYKYELPKHKRNDDKIGFIRGKLQIRVGNSDYVADVILADRKNAGIIFYDIVSLKPTKIKAAAKAISPQKGSSQAAAASTNNISQMGAKNKKFSLEVDSYGHKLTKDQQKYFKNVSSELRAENGALKVMYHGTPEANFTVFDPKFSDDNLSLFFTDSRFVAASYSGTEDYVDINNIRQKGAIKTIEDLKKRFEDTDFGVREEDGQVIIEEIGDLDDPVEYVREDSAEDAYREWVEQYSWNGEEGEFGGLYQVYLNLTHPLVVDAHESNWEEIYPEEIVDDDAEFYDKIQVIKKNDDGTVVVDWALSGGNGGATETMTDEQFREKFGDELYFRFRDQGRNLWMGDVIINPGGELVPRTTRELALYARNNMYDGLIINNLVDMGEYGDYDEAAQIAIAFNSSQVKSIYNEHPTEDEDIRYSIDVDSEGRMLTDRQQRYFNNTKVVDENGALKVMYHGARGAGFTVFRPEYSDDRKSLFFTDSRRVARSYSGTSDLYAPDKPMTYEELNKFTEDITRGDMFVEQDGNDTVVMELGFFNEPDKEVFRGSLKDAQTYIVNSFSEETHLSDAVYEVYLNVENPLVFDAKGSSWDELNQDAAWDKHFGDVLINKTENGYDVAWMDQDFEWKNKTFHSIEELEKQFGKLYEDFQFDEIFISDIYLDKNGDRIPTNTRMMSDMAYAGGHDGVIFKNMVDMGEHASPNEIKTSTVVVVFNPEQIKSVYNINPTSSEDIRYALDLEDEGGWIDFGAPGATQTTEEDAINVLEKGIEALKNKEVDVPKLRTLALKLRHEYGSTYNTNTLTDNLRKAFAYMQTEDHVDYKTMMGILKDIARPVIEQSGEKIGEQEYKDFLSYFKGKKIKLTSKQKEEVRYAFGSYKNFRNAVMPITFSDNADTTLDQLWDEMVEQSGYMLDRDASEGDMPANLLDVLQAMRPTMRNDFGGDIDDVSKDLAMRIVEEYIEGEAAKEMHKDVQEYRARLKKDYQERRKELTGQINAELRARNKRQAEQAKEREQVRILKGNIRVNANKLMTWVEKPTEGKSVPHNMMVPVVQFLQAIDFVDPVITMREDGKWTTKVFDRVDYEDGHKKFVYKDLVGDTREDVLKQFNEALERGEGSKAQRTWTEKMQGMREIYDKVQADDYYEDTSMDSLMQTLDGQGLAEDFDQLLADHKGELSMNHLDSKELGLINNIIKNIFHAVNQGNKAYTMNAEISTLAQDTMQDAEGKTLKTRTKFGQIVHDFFRIDNSTPVTFFKLLGNGASKIYKSMRGGLNQEIIDIKKASEFMAGVIDKETMEEIAKWTGDKAVVHDFALSSGSVKMTDGQIMGLYLTLRRTGARDRIKGGIRVVTKERNGREIKQNAIHLTDGDIKQIESVLTPKQIDVAKKMQQYMAVDCAAQGNETSDKLYGYRKFVDPTYYPWSPDKETVPTNNTSANIPAFTGIERSGFTKDLKKGANNPLLIYDVFDVFTDHVAGMAAYHGYAASVKDCLRWMNYREKSAEDNGFVNWNTNKKAINILSGSEGGVRYIQNLLLDINKARKSDYIGNMTEMFMGNYKAAAVGANMRVVIQQPTAYMRALDMIDPKYLLGVSPKTALKNVKKSQDECPISWWKSKGYYETNLGQPLKEIVTGYASTTEKIKDKLMSPAGLADDLTWGFLYTAVENEQRDLLRGKKMTPEEFRQAVNDRFDALVDSTQVVDSTLHRSAYMRSKDKLNVIQTAFMAEPTKTYNMLMEALVSDAREGKAWKRTSRAMVAFLLTAIVNAAAQSLPDVLRHARDDDDFWDKYKEYLLSNFGDNVNPMNLLPVIKDIAPEILNSITGESSWNKSNSRFDIDALTSIPKDLIGAAKYLTGDSNKTGYGAFMSLLRPVSQLTGIPLYNLTRDSVSLYNAFFENLETTVTSGAKAKNEKKKALVSDVNKNASEETIDEAITDAIEHGVSIYDLKGAIQSEYKNKYFDLYSEGKEEDARELADKAARAYARMGLTDEEIDEIINGWQEEAITYTALDKSIASGEGIEDEVKHVQEGKDDDKIIKHIMDRYTQTVAYEDTHDTESAWRSNVETALQTVDPTLTFDSAHEEAIEKKKAADEKAATTAKNTAMKQDFYDAVEKMDGSAGRKALEAMKNEGIEAKTVKSAVSTRYHEAWKEAKKQGDTAAMKKAESDWKSAYKLVNNVYNSKSDNLDQTWKKWEKEQE